ncbi:tannase/feruloyl esterase family alpha/beta hydrolase [Solimonas terrae]|uniref:Tannase/feruloyl esterase family alpha/beta hydrolase n=1 Tax=Solimonas terrae TaxID=1396819 RepID=A0A6M2BLK2_9GAMM|nr:tannase/feruloyl esterase family alpha/beta hydrolase [Solimonas terrae]NGY03304.1 tannase/feruloyl esterase family alpha/beta hydrolase [Solimonas terrae]
MKGCLVGFVVMLGLLCSGCALGAGDSKCDALKNLTLDQTLISSVDADRGGYSLSWKTAFIGVPWLKLPASCRVDGVIQPTSDSHIGFTVWMPARDWNGRFLGLGNGGFGGSIEKIGLSFALQHGYAVAATDTGHVASDLDGSWALGHPEKLLDYGYRAIHETAQKAKTLIAAYYGRPPSYSYFSGASNGGRQALMEAQRYPEDYDGILVGCPPADGATAMASSIWIQKQLNRSPAAYIPKRKLPAIAAATVAACDALDGVKDGVIDDPRHCNFHPESLRCAGKETNACLTAPQIESLRAIYSGDGGVFDGHRRRGYEPGGELGSFGGWAKYLLGSGPGKGVLYRYSLEFPRFLIYKDPQWTLDHFDVEKFHADAEHALGQIYSTDDPDLTAFKSRGGKLILFHGWSDPAIPPRLTVDYYERMRATMGTDSVDGFVRLYMVPGLQHGVGGPGANVFGQLAPGSGDARHNISAALFDWVEKGVAPGAIIASRYDGDLKPLLAPDRATLIRTRPLCPYPEFARWTGRGSSDDAETFSCVAPPLETVRAMQP